jgi:hypothetical protein
MESRLIISEFEEKFMLYDDKGNPQNSDTKSNSESEISQIQHVSRSHCDYWEVRDEFGRMVRREIYKPFY